MLRKSYKENTFTVFIGKYPHISGHAQFKPVLFKGQLYIILPVKYKLLNENDLIFHVRYIMKYK